MDTDTGSMN